MPLRMRVRDCNGVPLGAVRGSATPSAKSALLPAMQFLTFLAALLLLCWCTLVAAQQCLDTQVLLSPAQCSSVLHVMLHPPTNELFCACNEGVLAVNLSNGSVRNVIPE